MSIFFLKRKKSITLNMRRRGWRKKRIDDKVYTYFVLRILTHVFFWKNKTWCVITLITWKKPLFHSVFFYSFSQTKNEEQSYSEVLPLTTDTSSITTTTTTTNKKRKNKQLTDEQRLLTDMSDERLQVYGLNPKRFRNFVRFNKEKKN